MHSAAQQFAAAGFRQHRDKAHTGRPRHGAQVVVDQLHDLAFEFQPRALVAQQAGVLGHGKRHRHLTLELIGHAHHRHLGHVRMRRDALLDLARAQAVPGDVDHVVGAPQNEEVAIGVLDAPVKSAVHQPPRHRLPVGADEARIIAPNRLHATRRQRPLDGDHALLVGFGQLGAGLVVQQFHVVAVNRLAG